MTIFIGVIGRETDWVKTWLKEESGELTKLWVLHSPIGPKVDFPKIAKNLVTDLKKSYTDIEIKRKLISDSLTLDPTMDAIDEIIKDEEKKDEMLLRSEIVINITGGTNAIAAASMNSANKFQTKVHYVLKRQEGEPKNKKLVQEIPIYNSNKSDFTEFQKQVLIAIRDSEYFIPNTPHGIDPKITKGMIQNKELLKKLGWDKNRKGLKSGRTRLSEILKILLINKLVEKINYTELYVLKEGGKELPLSATIDKYGHEIRVKVNGKFYSWPLPIKRNDSEKSWSITPEGKRQSKNLVVEI
jgi:hypothetical protein